MTSEFAEGAENKSASCHEFFLDELQVVNKLFPNRGNKTKKGGNKTAKADINRNTRLRNPLG